MAILRRQGPLGEISKDGGWFLEFVGEVLGVLESPQPPNPSPNCQWCGYIGKLRDIEGFVTPTQ